MDFDKDQISRDISLDSSSEQDSQQMQNHSIILNCYQQKKVSLLNEQTLINDKSYYINFNIQQITNHKTYVMYVTSYRIYLMCVVDSQIVSIPHAYIKQFTCFDNSIRFSCKTGLKYFLLPVQSQETQQIYQSLINALKIIPFALSVKFKDQEPDVYDCLAQMERMLIDWRKVSAIDNKNGRQIPTYPKIVFIPAKVDNQVVRQNQKNRFNSRIPALTYYSQDHDVALWRCGHILKQQNSKYDFAYLEAISPNLLIIEIQQMQNRRQSVYCFNHFSNQIKYSIYKFEGLFQVKCNYEKMIGAYIRDDMASFWKALSKWYEEVEALIKCAWKTAEQIKKKRHVLIQQNDLNKFQNTTSMFSKGGVDRASQLCALVQIITDPYFRSMKGLSVLIQKEFLSFGYPFKQRSSYQKNQQFTSSSKKNTEQLSFSLISSMYWQTKQQRQDFSPTFIQFLECVHQLINCFPSYFEYSSQYLAQIGYEVYSAKYNNFLFNSIHQKHSFPDLISTQSLYQHIRTRKGYWNLQFCVKNNQKNLVNARDMPNLKEYLIWKEYWDRVTKMNLAEKRAEDSLETAFFRKKLKQRISKFVDKN